MDRKPWLVAAALAVTFLAFYLSNLPLVPFHPDESSWLYMSREFAGVVTRLAPPGSRPNLWSPDDEAALVQYRWLNAPLAKDLIGLSWWLRGFTAADLNTDWSWLLTWDDNVAAGHMPRSGLLWAGRLPGAVLSALSAVLLFGIVYQVRGLGAGLAAALLLGLNPLVLLHGRRAMAEGTLLFFSLLAVWGLVCLAQSVGSSRRRPLKLGLWAAAAGGVVGLALCSKQSAIALLPAGAAAVALPALRPSSGISLRRRLSVLVALWLGLGLGSGLTFWALNPILYRDLPGGLQRMVTARADLARRQTVTQAAFLPDTVTPDPLSRLRAALLEVYLRPPAVWDLPVYLDQLMPQAALYFAQPLQRFENGPAWGVLWAGLGVAGAAFSALRLWRDRLGQKSLAEQVVWWWALATLGVTLLATPFDWQRYFLPLIPLVCVFAALGAEMLARPVVWLISSRLSGKTPQAAML